MPAKPQKVQRKILVEVAKHPSGMQEADLRRRLGYIFQTDDIPVDLALLGMEEDGIVLLKSDGSVSSNPRHEHEWRCLRTLNCRKGRS